MDGFEKLLLTNWTHNGQMPNVVINDYINNFSDGLAHGNNSNIVDISACRLFSHYLLGIGGMLICCLGLVGNTLSLIVLTRRVMISSTYSYLSALAVCDSLVLLFTAILLATKDVYPPSQNSLSDEGIHPYLFPVIHPITFTLQVISIWLTLAFTVDRYIMICHPFQSEPLCTVGRARRVIAGLVLAGIICNIPKFFEYKTIKMSLFGNEHLVLNDLTAFGKSYVFRQLFHSWFYIIFISAIPFLAMAVLNGFLINAVRQSRRRGREISVSDKKRNDTTVMLIGVLVIFFICQTPALASRILWAFNNDTNVFSEPIICNLSELANFLVVLNSAINIVPYYFFGLRFRRHFCTIFCPCVQHKHVESLNRKLSTSSWLAQEDLLSRKSWLSPRSLKKSLLELCCCLKRSSLPNPPDNVSCDNRQCLQVMPQPDQD